MRDSEAELESHKRGTSESVGIDEAEADTRTPAECCQQLVSTDGSLPHQLTRRTQATVI